jgi:23S rRNA (cytosine1962-C5)-methyltransferase
MQILLLADTHLKPYNQNNHSFSLWEKNAQQYALDKIINTIKERGITKIVHLGDLLENSFPKDFELELVDYFFKNIPKGVEFIIIEGNPQNNTYRLVHGEGDNLPGLIIDVYDHTAVMQAHSAGMHLDRMAVAEALEEVMGDVIQHIYYKSETTLPFKADLLATENGFLKGGSPENVAMENGLKFHVDWLKGQKTGFFVDQRENRALLERYAKGRNVLNMFCYAGGFSFYAMRGGANLVHSVDSSAKAIDLTNENVSLNFPGDTRHQAFAEDAFKFLDRMGDQYDLIILDPPAFAKHRDALRNALRGYTKLNAKAFEKIRPGGILFTFSCSQVVNKQDFRNAVFTAAAQSGRSVRILHQLTQPGDHPVNIYHPEGEYLKGLVLYVE